MYMHGIPGVGKTLSVKLMCKSLGRHLVHINSSLTTSVESIRNFMGDTHLGGSLDGTESVVFFDECEALKQSNPAHTRKMTAFLQDLFETHETAIIFAANDDERVPEIIRKINLNLRFTPLKENVIIHWARNMIEKHHPEMSKLQIEQKLGKKLRIFAKQCNGDMRYFVSAMIDDIDYSKMMYESKITIQHLVRWTFSVKDSVSLKRKLMSVLGQNDKMLTPYNLIFWLEQNFYQSMKNSPNFFTNIKLLGQACEYMADIELFCSILSGIIPTRPFRTIKFPQMYSVNREIQAKKKERFKLLREKQNKTKKKIETSSKSGNIHVRKSNVKKEQDMDGGLAKWFK